MVDRSWVSITLVSHLSGRRAGWNVVTSWLGDTAANFSRTDHPAHATRDRIASEYLYIEAGRRDDRDARLPP